MCGVCGCGDGETRLEPASEVGGGHDHDHDHDHDHAPGPAGGHGHPHFHRGAAPVAPVPALEVAAAGAFATATPAPVYELHPDRSAPALEPLRDDPVQRGRMLRVEQDILSRNDTQAAKNRSHFQHHRVLALNLVSSPGAGKTTLLVETLRRCARNFRCAVIEGDQETSSDADRIRETGVPALQVNTGRGCHLDADMIDAAYERVHLEDGVLFIENVGNLVCPAAFDLGEAHRIVIASVTEGEDKPLKYPNMFASASMLLVSKVDLLPHLEFDVNLLIENARRINPGIAVIKISTRTGEGIERWLRWLNAARDFAAASADA